MNIQIALWALFLGLSAAVSMPLGTFTNLFWKPSEKILAFMLALASGALLAATLDLVKGSKEYYWYLSSGCIMGGMLFIFIGRIINEKGGFLRKRSLALRYLRKKKEEQYMQIFKELSKINLFHHLPPEEVQAIIPFITSRNYKKGTTLFHQGEPGDSMYIIDEGEISIVDTKNNKVIATLGPGETVGEMALVTGDPRSASAIAATDTKVWVILKEHFDKHLMSLPIVAKIVEEIVTERISDLKEKNSIDVALADKWVKNAEKNLNRASIVTTDADIKEAQEENKGSGMAIWLGNLFDAIPGSIVIGASAASANSGIGFALIAGMFLANFPEALSSSSDMQKQGAKFIKVLSMWSSLFIISGISAFLGCLIFGGVQHVEGIFTFLEGIAAGAMLTMIADTMLPEAYHKYASITGLSTLFGFLLAIFINTL
jgi:CRP-like cAMP-binding protein